MPLSFGARAFALAFIVSLFGFGANATLSIAKVTAPIKNFTQKADHTSSNSSATFQQQYQLVTDYFKPGGPILFVQGAENPVLNPVNNNVFLDYAPELGAIVANLEHRFFGSSFPVVFDPQNATAEDYATLTLDNIMKDAVEFVSWIKETVPGAENSKVIINGGSYGGTLATWARIREPNTFYGSIASSPGLFSWGSQGPRGNPQFYNPFDVVSNAYFDASSAAARKIQSAMQVFADCVLKGTCSEAIPDLGFCAQLDATQWRVIYELLIATYYSIAQMNFPAMVAFPWPDPLYATINRTLEATTAGQVLRIPLLGKTWTQSEDACFDYTNPNITGVSFIGASFLWLKCTAFPLSFGDSRPGSLLPPHDLEGKGFYGDCPVPEWQVPYFNDTSDEVAKQVGITNDILDKTERLLIIQGSYDIATGAGSPNLTVTSDRNHSRYIYVQGMAHTEDSFSSLVEPWGTREAIDQIRRTRLEYIKDWVGAGSNTSFLGTTGGSSPGSNGSSPVTTSAAPLGNRSLLVARTIFGLAVVMLLDLLIFGA